MEHLSDLSHSNLSRVKLQPPLQLDGVHEAATLLPEAEPDAGRGRGRRARMGGRATGGRPSWRRLPRHVGEAEGPGLAGRGKAAVHAHHLDGARGPSAHRVRHAPHQSPEDALAVLWGEGEGGRGAGGACVKLAKGYLFHIR